MPSAGRLLLLLAMVVGTMQLVAGASPRPAPLASPLATFPLDLDAWSGRDDGEIDADTRRVLGADEYLQRVYVDRAGQPVGLYVAFYASQQQGDSIHSPLHCLPGNGWVPVSHRRPTIQSATGRAFPVNRFIVEKRHVNQLVLYWFQGRGRDVASEYANKGYLLFDALRLRRTDGALVRLTTPFSGDASAVEPAVTALASRVESELARRLP